ncbi:hypothetical protein SAMN00790413_01135 [Deinococcus hopiensis KR-140]|uniref:Uncharacterized protein n=1 Tax=Deinococcus hopiensis KR-140 TaxID=695939 RepID=A0A1W1VDQ9_9DEIO|nr:hypothetical protein SAMN00790413_01135 [Deinococcus hopiensis KR-140]
MRQYGAEKQYGEFSGFVGDARFLQQYTLWLRFAEEGDPDDGLSFTSGLEPKGVAQSRDWDLAPPRLRQRVVSRNPPSFQRRDPAHQRPGALDGLHTAVTDRAHGDVNRPKDSHHLGYDPESRSRRSARLEEGAARPVKDGSGNRPPRRQPTLLSESAFARLRGLVRAWQSGAGGFQPRTVLEQEGRRLCTWRWGHRRPSWASRPTAGTTPSTLRI